MLLYRLVLGLLAPFLLASLFWRVLTRRESPADFNQRLGGGPSGRSGAIWLHGASNGELTSARALIEALRAAFPGNALIITANTTTGRDLVAGWRIAGVEARLAPLDLRWALARFRRRWRPVALISLENELWPNRTVTQPGPVLFIAARLSARSAGRWRRLPGLARAMLARVDRLYPQDQGSAARFAELGMAGAQLGPVLALKQDVALPDPPADLLAPLAAVFARPDTVLAASTHVGEEAAVLEAFARARAARPALRLILAPRHPRRGPEIAALIAAAGLRHCQRSNGAMPGPDTTVYLADTLGEMALWYTLAGVTFVGGSLVEKGGHTPFEPAQAGSAILHGPHVANFRDVYAALDAERAAIRIADAAGLAEALMALDTAARHHAMAARAAEVLAAAEAGSEGIEDAVAWLRARLA